MSPETQVQVSGIVLENSIFLKVFIQACGEGEIVAVMARFFEIMKTDIHHMYIYTQPSFREIPDKGMVP